MFPVLAAMAYLAAVGIAILLLQHFGSAHWSWHVLTILAALGLGLMPAPDSLQGPSADIVYGSVFICLMTWGIGGIVAFRPHHPHQKHA